MEAVRTEVDTRLQRVVGRARQSGLTSKIVKGWLITINGIRSSTAGSSQSLYDRLAQAAIPTNRHALLR